MKLLFFLTVLVLADLAPAQEPGSGQIYLGPYDRSSTKKPGIDANINYFPFYNGLQVIEVDYYERFIPNRPTEKLPALGVQLEQVNYAIIDKPNGYLVRNRMGVVIRNYGVSNLRKLKLESPGKAKVITHKERLEAGMFQWYNINGEKKYTKHLASGYGYVYRKEDHSYHLIDTLGMKRFSNCDHILFFGSVYAVQKNGSVALFDLDFEQRTPFQYYNVIPIFEGILMANNQFINLDGELLDTTRYDKIEFDRTQDTHIIYRLNGKYGLIDRNLKDLTGPRFKSIKPLKKHGFFVINDDNKLALLNDRGEQITPFKYEADWPYWREDGYMEVREKHIGWGIGDRGYPIGTGLLDSTGSEAIPPIYGKIESIHEGRGPAYLNGYYGLVNTNGEELTAFIYDKLTFDSGYFIAEVSGKKGLLDSNGREVIPLVYQEIGSIREDMARVRDGSGKYGYRHLNGGQDISVMYEGGSRFFGGVAWIRQDGKQGLIDKSGNELTDFKYDVISTYNFKYWWVKKGEMFGAIDATGKEIVPLIYTGMEYMQTDSTIKFLNEKETYLLSK